MSDIIFSGIQPSGELHLGNWLGAVQNWVRLQDRPGKHIYCIVDLHALTQDFDPAEMKRRTLEMATDLLACGIDPARSPLFVQSHVAEHTELAWVLNTVTPFGDLGRMTQFKDKSARQADNINTGLFTYPVLQAADILLYRASQVPVGADQVQHLERSRDIARKFNARYGDLFPEPKPLLTQTPKIVGLDGEAKMSKSVGNTITLGESEEVVRKKLSVAVTDPARKRRTDPGNPDICNIHSLHTIFSSAERVAEVRAGCTGATIGCLQCKSWLADGVVAALRPIQERRRELEARPDEVQDALRDGARAAQAIARETMTMVRERLGLWRG
ncbi:MAG: tryptophan--tRNA ligase [Deltaproteobacteria bacterium]|nr:tryptophan--tRNA ligase [Deltaproteobacteria bacterium]